jgi:YHYH protein
MRTAILILALCAAPSRCPAQPATTDVLDPHALPLGDGRVSPEPRRGSVFACMTRFRGGGARHAGDWIHGATWDPDAKLHVLGSVAWPQARFTVEVAGGERRVRGNGLPVGEPTGVFPVQRSDPAFAIDRNPNRIEPQALDFTLPLAPAVAAAPSCVPMGMIGVMLNGVVLFDALDDAGRDAVAHEVQDRCDGHPESRGRYHYHGPSPCVPGENARNAVIGYALDGFGITSPYDENGRELTNADLDECHGRVSAIEWDGRPVRMYHYVMTREYPYTVGCFRGRPARVQGAARPPERGGEGSPGRGMRRGGPPPRERRPPPG